MYQDITHGSYAFWITLTWYADLYITPDSMDLVPQDGRIEFKWQQVAAPPSDISAALGMGSWIFRTGRPQTLERLATACLLTMYVLVNDNGNESAFVCFVLFCMIRNQLLNTESSRLLAPFGFSTHGEAKTKTQDHGRTLAGRLWKLDETGAGQLGRKGWTPEVEVFFSSAHYEGRWICIRFDVHECMWYVHDIYVHIYIYIIELGELHSIL